MMAVHWMLFHQPFGTPTTGELGVLRIRGKCLAAQTGLYGWCSVHHKGFDMAGITLALKVFVFVDDDF